MPGVDDNQIPVYYFAKVQEHNLLATAIFNEELKDSVYQANNELFPQYKGREMELMNHIIANFEKGTLKASFIIDKQGKVKSHVILSADTISNRFAEKVCRAFGHVTWQPAIKNRIPVNCIVQVTIHTGRSEFPGTSMMMNDVSMEFDFLPKAPYSPMDPDDFETSQQYLKDAVNLYNSGNSDKAVELLAKYIEIDNINMSVYSFRASINAKRGKIKEACKDWATLAAYGQVEGVKKLAEFCKN